MKERRGRLVLDGIEYDYVLTPVKKERPKRSRKARPETVATYCAATDPLDKVYHDEEWGVPVREDRKLFE